MNIPERVLELVGLDHDVPAAVHLARQRVFLVRAIKPDCADPLRIIDQNQ